MQRTSKIISLSVGLILAGSLAVVMLWPKHNPRPPVLSVLRAEPKRYIADEAVMRWVIVCASNQNTSLPELSLANVSAEIRLSNQWLKTEGRIGGVLKPGEWCTQGFLVPAQADTLRVRFVYFQGEAMMKRKQWDNALIWIPSRAKNRIPDSLWKWLYGLRMPPAKNLLHVSLEVTIPN